MSNIEKLSSSSSLKDLVDRQELLTNNVEEQKNTLKEILISKNVVVSEEDNKLSILIQKVDELNNNTLWLYKDGKNKGEIKQHYIGSTSSSITFNSSYIQIKSIGSSTVSVQQCVIGTQSSLDLTGYTKLRVVGKLSQVEGKITFGVGSDNTTSNFTSKTEINGDKLTNNYEFDLTHDISTMSNGFVKFEFRRNYTSGEGICDIYKIWLEK